MRKQGATWVPLAHVEGEGNRATPEGLGRRAPSCGLLLAAYPQFSNTGCTGASICTYMKFPEHLLVPSTKQGAGARRTLSTAWWH